jgi:penicillin-binding protein 2
MEIEVDAVGKQVSNISDTPAKNGKDIKLYMDYNLQKKSYELMKGKKGCIIAIEPETGGIISMTSVPSFNINKFTSRSLSKKDYKELTDDKDLPLFNRCLAGTYPPASLIKPFTALGALEYEVIKPSYTIWDKGWYKLAGNNRKYRNWKRSGHGSVDLHKAIMVSNDTYFYNLAYRMSIDKISTNLADFGFGTKVGLDVGKNEKIGILPTRAWKKKYKKLDWFPGDTINVGIGQGYLLTTPMQLVYATSIIANRGKRNLLRFIKEIDGQKELFAKNPDDLKFKKENIDFIINAMHDVMQNKKGTGYWRAGRFSRYQVAGKTGTAQVIAMQQEEKRYDKTKVKKRFHDNAMFLGFSPLKKPKIPIIVIIENGGGGGSIAAPIGVKLMNYYLDMQKKNRKFVSK